MNELEQAFQAHRSGRVQDAIDGYRRALKTAARWEVWHNLAVLLAQQGQDAEAVQAFESAAAMAPANRTEPLVDLGRLLQQRGQVSAAGRVFETLVQRQPGAETWNLLGTARAAAGEREAAIEAFEQAIRIDPRHGVALSNRLLALSHDPACTPEALLAEHRWWERLAAPAPPLAPPAAPRAPGPIRVGFVSPDFRQHAIARLIEGVFLHHDRERFHFHAYASGSSSDDVVTERLRGLVPTWRSIAALDDRAAAERVRQDGIDILIDLAGHTAGHRLGLMARRAAPMQLTWLGYPGTTGLSCIDARLTSADLDPASHPTPGSERALPLPGPFFCWTPPDPATTPLPVCPPPGDDAGGGIVFGAPHKLIKLNDEVLALWSDLLLQTPGSRLHLIRDNLDEAVRQRLTRAFADRGVDPARLQFRTVARAEAAGLRYLDGVDLMLDTWPWSGHVTTLEALWMGVPVLTLRGDRAAGRMGAAILGACGLDELVAATPDDYRAIAVRLARSPAHLRDLQARVRPALRQSALCDAQGFTRGLETTLAGLVAR